jgi:hypothetical protein
MAEHRAGKDYKEAAKATILAQLREQMPAVVTTPIFSRAQYTAEFWVAGRYDDDNIVALLKWPQDALKWAGIVRDDKRPWLRLAGVPEQHVVRIVRRKGESDGDLLKRKWTVSYRVELTVEEVNG